MESFKTVTKLISILENSDIVGKFKMLNSLYSDSASSSGVVIGFTGAPGSGKSSLLFEVLSKLPKELKPLVVFAVDPSSHFTGGAILGDRVRFSEIEDIYFRSFATRGRYGGLSAVILDAIELAGKHGFKHIAIESAGVGQNEVEISGVVDYVFAVFNPTSGDAVQGIKAGLLEIADCVIVNKSDTGNVNFFLKDLELSLKILNKKDISVIKTSVITGEGIPELVELVSNVFTGTVTGCGVARRRSNVTSRERAKKFFEEDVVPLVIQEMVDRKERSGVPTSGSTAKQLSTFVNVSNHQGAFAESFFNHVQEFIIQLDSITKNLLLSSSERDPEGS